MSFCAPLKDDELSDSKYWQITGGTGKHLFILNSEQLFPFSTMISWMKFGLVALLIFRGGWWRKCQAFSSASLFLLSFRKRSFRKLVLSSKLLFHFWQAWKALSSLQLYRRNYVRPGQTVQPVKNISASHIGGRSVVPESLHDSSVKLSVNPQHNQISLSNNKVHDPTRYYVAPAPMCQAVEVGKNISQNQSDATVVRNYHTTVSEGSWHLNAKSTSDGKGSDEAIIDAMNDDEILEVIHTILYCFINWRCFRSTFCFIHPYFL